MSCKKCNLPKTVTLRKKDYYCNDCFMTNTNHKFRACLGKNKVLLPNEHVLICLSGGVGSTVLLDLTYHSLSLDNTKKLRIIPFFLHIIEDDQTNIAEYVIGQCNKYSFNVYMVHLSDYMNTTHQLPEVNYIPTVNQHVATEFQNMLKGMPPTAINDFRLKIKRNLFIIYAKQLNCNIVFTAETTSILAINLLCNIAVGRGSQVQNDVGFCDNRDEKVKILRPIRDISKEELDYYLTIKQLKPICNNNIKNNSLQSVISTFVCDLQENFQSTISTVCKTADKIGIFNDSIDKKCLVCESDLKAKDLKMSALEATNVSRTVSLSNTQNNQTYNNILNECENNAVFPLVHEYLCYGCSRNHSEMNKPNLTQYLQIYNT